MGVRHSWKSTAGTRWWWQQLAGDAAVATAPASPPKAPPLRRYLGATTTKKSSRSEYRLAFVSFPLCFPLTAAKSHFAVNHRIIACFLLQTWLSFPAEQAVLRHGMSPVLLISKMPPQANCVNIGECRSGGERCPPSVVIIHRSPSRWGMRKSCWILRLQPGSKELKER